MAKKLNELTKTWSPQRKARVRQKANDMRYGIWLRQVRNAYGLTQAEVAARMGVSRSRVSQIETGVDMSTNTMVHYLSALTDDVRLTVALPQGEASEMALQG